MYHQLLMLLFNNITMVSSFVNSVISYTTPSIDTTGDDIIFNTSTIFTMAVGERLCFNVTIVDDDEIEYDEYHGFSFEALNDSLPFHHFYDYTRIIIRDNEGQKLYKSTWLLCTCKLFK